MATTHDKGYNMTEHQTTVAVEGHVASCTCGWTQRWIRADGSAHEAASAHRASHEKEYNVKGHEFLNREFREDENKSAFQSACLKALSMKLNAYRSELIARVNMATAYPEVRRELEARHGNTSWPGNASWPIPADTITLERIDDYEGIPIYVLTLKQPERHDMVFMTDNVDIAWIHYDDVIEECRSHYGIEVKA